MAPWFWMKLRYPLTPDDVLASRSIVSTLSLPPRTSQFVLALQDPRSPSSVVYLLSVEKLSERSIDDIHSLVAAVHPSSVVAFVDDKYITDVGDEETLLDGAGVDCLSVPTSVTDVLKSSFIERTKASVYESRAGLRVLINVFGTTFYGNIIAAKKAAADVKANFEYLRAPSTAIASFYEKGVEDGGSKEIKEEGTEEGTKEGLPFAAVFERFSSVLSDFFGDNNSEYLTGASHRVVTRSLSGSDSQELRTLAPAFASGVYNFGPGSGIVSGGKDDPAVPNVEPAADDLGNDCPAFATPFFPIFVDLHNLFEGTPGINQALRYAKKVLRSIDNGDDVNHEDLSRARAFRVAVESIRFSWNSFNQRHYRASRNFSQLSPEEKCQALLAQALKHQAQKCKTVVAVVDASSVSGIRKHWNTVVPAEVAAYAEYCFVSLDPDDLELNGGLFNSSVLEKPETKAAVVVSAGAAAAVGIVSLPSVSTLVKVLTFKVPAVLKIVFLQAKRSAIISLTKAITPATNIVVPAFKAVGSGKVAFVPSSSAKVIALKSAASAEKVRITAHGMVAAAERASLQAIRTAFYSLMRDRQAKILGPRPWLMLAGTLTTAAGVLAYGDGLEHAISIVPSAPGVARLGRGLEKLDQAALAAREVGGPNNWQRLYNFVPRHSKNS